MSLLLDTKLYIQKYDGLENTEKPSRALEVNLASSTDTSLGHKTMTLFYKYTITYNTHSLR
jgi:hypothetical protein